MGATELLKTPSRPSALERHLLDHLHRAQHVRVVRVVQEILGSGENSGERLSELVRCFAGHLAVRGQALPLHGLLVGRYDVPETGADLGEVRPFRCVVARRLG